MNAHFEKGSEAFKESWENSKDAASDMAEGVTHTAKGVGEEVREALDDERA